MPHFTLQVDTSGPVVNAGVRLTASRSEAVIAAGGTPPQVQVIRALVDTGASLTCIDPQVFVELGLTPTGTVEMNTPSTGADTTHTTNTYDVDFLIGAAGSTPRIAAGLW